MTTVGRALAAVIVAAAACSSCGRDEGASQKTYTWPSGEPDPIAESLAPESSPARRDGLAAAILIDVSGSMSATPRGSAEPKIVSARRAALDLVDQFGRYAADHANEPVLLGIYEFSTRYGVPDAREVIPMGPPDRSRASSAVAAMKPGGDTPIGNAMVAGKRALDATGLSRRHLLVITDGQNTKGAEPEDVAAAIGRRPEVERPSLYFVAFDVNAKRFEGVKQTGALVLEAADSTALNQTLDMLLRGQILLER